MAIAIFSDSENVFSLRFRFSDLFAVTAKTVNEIETVKNTVAAMATIDFSVWEKTALIMTAASRATIAMRLRYFLCNFTNRFIVLLRHFCFP